MRTLKSLVIMVCLLCLMVTQFNIIGSVNRIDAEQCKLEELIDSNIAAIRIVELAILALAHDGVVIGDKTDQIYKNQQVIISNLMTPGEPE